MDPWRDHAAAAGAVQGRGYTAASGAAQDVYRGDSVLAPGPYLLRSAAVREDREDAPVEDGAGGERSSAALCGFRVVSAAPAGFRSRSASNGEHRRRVPAAAAFVFLA